MGDGSFYQAVLGLADPRVVEGVELRSAEQEVWVRVGPRPAVVLTCPECKRRLCGLRSGRGAAVATPGHHAVPDDPDQPGSEAEVQRAWRSARAGSVVGGTKPCTALFEIWAISLLGRPFTADEASVRTRLHVCIPSRAVISFEVRVHRTFLSAHATTGRRPIDGTPDQPGTFPRKEDPMRSKMLQAATVAFLALLAAAANANSPEPASLGCPDFICSNACPPFPDIVCQGFGCSDGDCKSDPCSSFSYKIDCQD